MEAEAGHLSVGPDELDRTKLNLKAYLLVAGYAGDQDDTFDVAMRAVRWLDAVPPTA